ESEMEVMMGMVVVTDLRWGGGGCDGSEKGWWWRLRRI
ncbi:hypothetical protein A2U01_0052208, partial [Trifolium medium]|nr:hypothetical protein [Trifolium medium]